MLTGAIAGLITAFILSLFDFDQMLIYAAKQFGYVITSNTYYVLFIVIGAIGGSFKKDD